MEKILDLKREEICALKEYHLVRRNKYQFQLMTDKELARCCPAREILVTFSAESKKDALALFIKGL